MLDIVACALVLVVPLLVFSIYQVKVHRRYTLHKRLQILLGALLLVAVGLFEIDMRWQGGVRGILAKRTVPLTPDQNDFFYRVLVVHLFFAVSTVFLWSATLILALRRMPKPPAPCPHSALHKRLGWLSALDITATSVTGLLVYYYGFVV